MFMFVDCLMLFGFIVVDLKTLGRPNFAAPILLHSFRIFQNHLNMDECLLLALLVR